MTTAMYRKINGIHTAKWDDPFYGVYSPWYDRAANNQINQNKPI